MSYKWLLALLAIILTNLNTGAQALSFNGTSSYVKVSNNSTLQLQNFTLEAWIYISGTGTASGTSSTTAGHQVGTVIPLITKGRNGKDSVSSALNYFFGYRLSDRRLVADFEDNTTLMEHHPMVGTGSLPLTTWTHVAVTYSTTGVWKTYINGKLDATLSLGKTFVPQSKSLLNVAFASGINSSGIAEGFFKGKLDEVRIWNIERSSAQIAAAYNQEISGATGLASRWSLNENTGTSVKNSVSGGYTGYLVNSPAWTTGYPSYIENTAPDAPVYTSPSTGSTVSTTSTNLCVSVNDPQKSPVTVSYYARKKTSTKKFTIVILPDPQYYVAEPQGTAYIKGAYNIMYKTQTRWVAANRASRNIVYVGVTGDCTDHGDSYVVEWKRSDTAIRTLEDSTLTGLRHGIPYGLPVGNHDQAPRGDPKGATYYYNKFFGSSRYQGRDYYGGHYGTNNDNHYQLFSASGIDFLVLCPEWDMTSGFTAPGGVLDWMENLVNAHPNRKVIVLSHYLINLQASFTTQGQAIYSRLKHYPNFLMMSSGHIVNETTGNGEARRKDTYNGKVVHSITQDYQARTNGGNGLLRTYEFDPANNKVAVQTYSPYTKTYETDSESQFSLDMDLSVSSTFKLIGQKTGVASGTNACFSWTGLEKDAVYEWYATVSDGQSTTTGPIWSFTTTAATTTSIAANDRIVETILEEEAAAANVEPQPELQGVGAFTIFPNPASTRQVSIYVPSSLNGGWIEMYNLAGQLVSKELITTNDKTIRYEHNLPNGMYKMALKQKDQTVIGVRNLLISK